MKNVTPDALNKEINISLLLFIVYLFLRVLVLTTYDINFTWKYPDTRQYSFLSRLSIMDSRFWYFRPFLYPLFLKIFSPGFTALFVQFLLSCITWWLFAYSLIYKKVQHYAPRACSIVLSGLILGLSFSTKIDQFNILLLTESLSITLLLSWVYCFSKWIDSRFDNTMYFLGFAVCFVLYLLLRDINAYFSLACVPLFIFMCIFYKKRTLFYATGIFIFCVMFTQYTSNQGERWCVPLGNVLSSRLIFYPNANHFFKVYGMPESTLSYIRQYQGTFEGRKLCPIDTFVSMGNQLNDFKDKKQHGTWIQLYGKKMYQSFLILTPNYFFSPFSFPCQEGMNICKTLHSVSDPLNHYNQRVPTYKHIIFFTNSLSYIYSFILLSVLCIVCCVCIIYGIKHQYTRNSYWQSFAYLWSISVGFALIIIHADAMEIERHILLVYMNLFVFGFNLIAETYSIALGKKLSTSYAMLSSSAGLLQ